MKYNGAIDILKIFVKALLAPEAIAYNPKKRYVSNYSSDLESNNSMNNSIYAEHENSNNEYNESNPMKDSRSYNDNNTNNQSNCYYNNQQYTSSNPQGVIDSISQEITPVRLQQAIILSEIVGKPRSNTKKRRKF
jgi:ABC-type proline/glycine betaine transport system ATPase subunit